MAPRASEVARSICNKMLHLRHLKPLSLPKPASSSTPHTPLPSPIVAVVLESYDAYDWQGSSDALTDWLNAR